ncbi:hypothetical protein Barb7_02603 [Bacteroidales bacterium Barb7]|nr:hypothetical protein Barb7_02603 [Bacteroidales bacterium Barb7]
MYSYCHESVRLFPTVPYPLERKPAAEEEGPKKFWVELLRLVLALILAVSEGRMAYLA